MADSFALEIIQAFSYMKLAGVEDHISNPSSFKVSPEFRSMCFDATVTYEALYLYGLRLRQYNFLLSDYSFFQFSGKENGEVRYAFYPNPFIGAKNDDVRNVTEMDEYLTEGAIEMEDYLHAISEIRNSQHPPLTRYEYAEAQYKELEHPCSHIHFGHHSDNRWPVRRKLTPQAFSLMVIKYYYVLDWKGAKGEVVGRKTLSLDDLYTKHRTDCSLVPSSHFSVKEEQQFHWA